MRSGIHVRVDPDRHGRLAPENPGPVAQAGELAGTLHVEAADAELQREVDFGHRLADPGENHSGRVAPGADDPLQLSAGDDVETGAELGEQPQNGEVGIRFDGIADFRVERRERVFEPLVLSAQVC